MLKKLIYNIRRFYLKRYSSKNRKRRFVTPLNEVKRIGIIYPYNNENDVEIRRFTKKLSALGIVTNTLGFVEEKELDGRFSPNLRSDYFCLKDVNKLKLPIRTNVMRFISEQYDYLIVSTTEVHEPLFGVASLSKANMRVGKYLKEYDFCFDIMIKGKHKDIKALNEEIFDYLTKFRNE
jgi:hypothetical protein